jgi:IMP cyclohydrolase
MDLDDFIGKMITGKQLNHLLNGMPLLKFMNDSDTHHGMHYVDGDNLDILPFNDSGECESGGLYVTQLKDYYLYHHGYGKYARRVRISDTALIYVEQNKLKCDEIYLEDRMPKDELLEILFTEYLQDLLNCGRDIATVVKSNGDALQYIKNHMMTPEIIFEAVKQNGDALQYIKDYMKTPEIILEAVKQNGHALQYIKDCMMTHDIMMGAVKQNGHALIYIKDCMKTYEIMSEAVKQNGYALQYINDSMKTPEIILEAVKISGRALQYIDDEMKTPEIMHEAVKNNGWALEFIKDCMKTPEIMSAATNNTRKAFQFISNDLFRLLLKFERKKNQAVAAPGITFGSIL